VIVAPNWVGLENYQTAFTKDPQFWTSLDKTARYALLAVPLGVVSSLGAAMLLNQGFRGTALFRTFFFLPSIMPIIASVLVWIWIFQPSIGVMNYLLSLIGVPGPSWIQSSTWALPSLVIVSLWSTAGGSRMVVFLAGLQGVPNELYEAAHIDGAGVWSRFWFVTLPLLVPTILLILLLRTIWLSHHVDLVYIMTVGGPGYSNYTVAVYSFLLTTSQFEIGYASAVAVVLAVALLAISSIYVRHMERTQDYLR
jgi:multiple sugar transport system permease protein